MRGNAGVRTASGAGAGASSSIDSAQAAAKTGMKAAKSKRIASCPRRSRLDGETAKPGRNAEVPEFMTKVSSGCKKSFRGEMARPPQPAMSAKS
jgi:hypothetical protein